jgi:hypothetical protein
MKYAILIDAGFLKRKLGSHSEPLDIGGVHAFLAMLRAQGALADMRLHRVYWYDAPPLECRVAKPLLGGRINFGATALARANVIPTFMRRDGAGLEARVNQSALPVD